MDEEKKLEELKLKVDDLYYTVSKKLGLGSNDIKGSVMRSTNFLTGTRGWRITPDGTAEFQSIITPGLARFGGTGADGALSITSGTTTIDLLSARVVTRNYTSISITGTAALAFSNPHAEGTTILLRSQGNVTITSSAARAIDLRSLGGTGGSGDVRFTSTIYSLPGKGLGIGGAMPPAKYKDTTTGVYSGNGGAGGGGASSGTNGALGDDVPFNFLGIGGRSLTSLNIVTLWAESGGGGSGGTGGGATGSSANGSAGGRGAGGLVIECKGALNITGTIDASGEAGTAGGSAAGGNGGGGGGGAGGQILIAYITLTADTGTYTVTGGAAGAGGSGGGGGTPGAAGAGSAGESLRVSVG